MTPPLLQLNGVHTHIGSYHILHGVDLAFEPGRAIVGPAGVTVYEVGTVKPVELDHGHERVYVSVDGGMSDNIRTALYDADYTVILASRVSSAPPVLCRVVGKHCESGDVIVRDAWLRGQELTVHGWIYGLRDGLLRDLECSASTQAEAAVRYKSAIAALAS